MPASLRVLCGWRRISDIHYGVFRHPIVVFSSMLLFIIGAPAVGDSLMMTAMLTLAW